MIQQYKVVLASSADEMAAKVQDHLAAKWELQGGISVTIQTTTRGDARISPGVVASVASTVSLIFAQAMVHN